MVKPGEPKTVINVKGVSVAAWERAKLMANREGQMMGEWLTGAINHRADMQSGPREIPPEIAPVKPPAIQPQPEAAAALAQLMQATAALYMAAGRPIPLRRTSALGVAVDEVVRQLRGLPPKQARLASGQSVTIVGQSRPSDAISAAPIASDAPG